jgi:hypothetical protein
MLSHSTLLQQRLAIAELASLILRPHARDFLKGVANSIEEGGEVELFQGWYWIQLAEEGGVDQQLRGHQADNEDKRTVDRVRTEKDKMILMRMELWTRICFRLQGKMFVRIACLGLGIVVGNVPWVVLICEIG